MTPQELEAAMLNPGSMFASPEEVLENAELSRHQKIEVLLHWEYDAAVEAVALEEGMPGQESDLLQRILAALGKLTASMSSVSAHPSSTALTVYMTDGRQAVPKPACAIPDLGPDAYARWRASEVGLATRTAAHSPTRGRRRRLPGARRRLRRWEVRSRTRQTRRDRGGHRCLLRDIIDAARAREKRPTTGVRFQVAMAQRLPCAAGQFDVVTAVTILCFVEDAAPVLREIARVLRQGGLVIGELGKWSTWAVARRMRGWVGSRIWRRGRFWTANELHSLLSKPVLSLKPCVARSITRAGAGRHGRSVLSTRCSGDSPQSERHSCRFPLANQLNGHDVRRSARTSLVRPRTNAPIRNDWRIRRLYSWRTSAHG